MKLLSFGEILWDLYPTEKYIGGAPFNFAAHVAKHGESVYLLSCLGMDDLSDEALERLKAAVDGPVRVYDPDGVCIALGIPVDGELKMDCLLAL